MSWEPRYPGWCVSISPQDSSSNFFLSRAKTWASVKIIPSLATFSSKAFNLFLKLSKSCLNQTQRTPQAEINTPILRSSLLTLTCPNAGYSTAIFITANSVSSHTRFFKFGFLRDLSIRFSIPPVSTSSLYL